MSGKRMDVAYFLRGRHALVPWYRPDDIEVVAELTQSFVLDNSAFTMWRQGIYKGWEGYFEWVRKWQRCPAFRWAVIPDTIEGSEEDNDRLLMEWPDDLTGIPVWHYHESYDRLLQLANHYQTIALGSSGDWSHPGTPEWYNKTDEIFDQLCDADGFPICKVHGFRMAHRDMICRYPFASVDSTNAAQNANRGDDNMTYGQRALVLAMRTESYEHAVRFDRSRRRMTQGSLFEAI